VGAEYSNLKMAWWLSHDGGLPSVPKQAQIVLSDLCNQDCHFCAYRMDGYSSSALFTKDAPLASYGHNNPKRFIPTARALDLLSECKDAGVLGVQFTGGGEPTVHPQHEHIFRRAIDIGLAAALVSNGIRWSDPLAAELLPTFSWVRVSVDAGTAQTYATIRNTSPDSFERVWRNVKRLTRARAEAATACVVGVGYVVTPENWREIREGVLRARDSGAAYIRLSAMFGVDGLRPYETIYPMIRDKIADCQVLACPSFTIHDLFGARIEDLALGNPDYRLCSYQYLNTYIGADENVYRCCVYSYNQRGLIGSIASQSFSSLWHSPKREADMASFDARGCERCQFNDKNRIADYILGPKPLHAEFP
jgi:MoaA/NifB/PqqE/SkfB family radical SAM enzyme